jgi:hypothetical protein
MVEMPPGPAGALRVVVAPMNLAVPLGPDLQDAVEPVNRELLRYLQAHGARVAVIFAPDAIALWSDVAEALAGRASHPGGDPVPSAFARSVASEAAFDLLVLPSLVYRDARVEGRVAQWDGVRRRIRFTSEVAPAAASDATRASGENLAPEPGWRTFRGKITGLSLHALVFDPQGKIVSQGFGGLDLVHEVREGKGADESSLRLQTEVLANAANVREGIAVVLDPVLVARSAAR